MELCDVDSMFDLEIQCSILWGTRIKSRAIEGILSFKKGLRIIPSFMRDAI